jgi:hypothetical protein
MDMIEHLNMADANLRDAIRHLRAADGAIRHMGRVDERLSADAAATATAASAATDSLLRAVRAEVRLLMLEMLGQA